MDLFNTITNLFIPTNNKDIICLDKFSTFLIKYSISNFKEFDENVILDMLDIISNSDSFELSFKIGNNDEICLKNTDLSPFCSKILDERKILEEEPVLFKLEIQKNAEEAINIYNFNSFQNFWKSTSISNLLHLIKNNKSKDETIIFLLLEENVESFYSQNIRFLKSNTPVVNVPNNLISDSCHFGNINDYPFNPYFFHLIKRPLVNNEITEKLDRISLLFSIISIYDITSIVENRLYYKLNGYRTFEGEKAIDNLDTKLYPIYFKIFDWIYSETSKIHDKIGLTRNIISLSIKENEIYISDSVFLSIQSSYKTYLKDNINKYIEIRNKIIDELGWISQKSSEIVSNYLSNYQKSIFTFLSFFTSVFLLKFLNKQDNSSFFSKNETVFSIAFLFLSAIYLLFSIWNIYLEKKRLTRKYENVKTRYYDLLNVNDINRILDNDEEFNYEMNFITIRQKIYTLLWVVTILLLICAILTVSNYINWNTILISIYDYT